MFLTYNKSKKKTDDKDSIGQRDACETVFESVFKNNVNSQFFCVFSILHHVEVHTDQLGKLLVI